MGSANAGLRDEAKGARCLFTKRTQLGGGFGERRPGQAELTWNYATKPPGAKAPFYETNPIWRMDLGRGDVGRLG